MPFFLGRWQMAVGRWDGSRQLVAGTIAGI